MYSLKTSFKFYFNKIIFSFINKYMKVRYVLSMIFIIYFSQLCLALVPSNEYFFLDQLTSSTSSSMLTTTTSTEILEELQKKDLTQFTRFNTESHRLRIPIQTTTLLEHLVINKDIPAYAKLLTNLFTFVKESQNHDIEKDTIGMNKTLAKNYGKDYDLMSPEDKEKAYKSRDVLNANGKKLEQKSFLNSGYGELSQKNEFQFNGRGKRFKEIIIYADLYDTQAFRVGELKHNKTVADYIQYLIDSGKPFEGVDMKYLLQMAKDLDADVVLQKKLYERSLAFAPANYIPNRKSGLHFSKIQQLQREKLINQLAAALSAKYLNYDKVMLVEYAKGLVPLMFAVSLYKQSTDPSKSLNESLFFLGTTSSEYALGYKFFNNSKAISAFGILYSSDLNLNEMATLYSDSNIYNNFLNLSLEEQEGIILRNNNSTLFSKVIYRSRPKINSLQCSDDQNKVVFEHTSLNLQKYTSRFNLSNQSIETAKIFNDSELLIQENLKDNITCFKSQPFQDTSLYFRNNKSVNSDFDTKTDTEIQNIKNEKTFELCIYDFSKDKIKELPTTITSSITIDFYENHFKNLNWIKLNYQKILNCCGDKTCLQKVTSQ